MPGILAKRNIVIGRATITNDWPKIKQCIPFLSKEEMSLLEEKFCSDKDPRELNYMHLNVRKQELIESCDNLFIQSVEKKYPDYADSYAFDIINQIHDDLINIDKPNNDKGTFDAIENRLLDNFLLVNQEKNNDESLSKNQNFCALKLSCTKYLIEKYIHKHKDISTLFKELYYILDYQVLAYILTEYKDLYNIDLDFANHLISQVNVSSLSVNAPDPQDKNQTENILNFITKYSPNKLLDFLVYAENTSNFHLIKDILINRFDYDLSRMKTHELNNLFVYLNTFVDKCYHDPKEYVFLLNLAERLNSFNLTSDKDVEEKRTMLINKILSESIPDEKSVIALNVKSNNNKSNADVVKALEIYRKLTVNNSNYINDNLSSQDKIKDFKDRLLLKLLLGDKIAYSETRLLIEQESSIDGSDQVFLNMLQSYIEIYDKLHQYDIEVARIKKISSKTGFGSIYNLGFGSFDEMEEQVILLQHNKIKFIANFINKDFTETNDVENLDQTIASLKQQYIENKSRSRTYSTLLHIAMPVLVPYTVLRSMSQGIASFVANNFYYGGDTVTSTKVQFWDKHIFHVKQILTYSSKKSDENYIAEINAKIQEEKAKLNNAPDSEKESISKNIGRLRRALDQYQEVTAYKNLCSDVQSRNAITEDGAFVEYMQLANQANKFKNKADKQYVVYFSGSHGTLYDFEYLNLLKTGVEVVYVTPRALVKDNNLFDNNNKKFGLDGLAVIEDLQKQGVSINNITLLGYCSGTAAAVETHKLLAKKNMSPKLYLTRGFVSHKNITLNLGLDPKSWFNQDNVIRKGFMLMGFALLNSLSAVITFNTDIGKYLSRLPKDKYRIAEIIPPKQQQEKKIYTYNEDQTVHSRAIGLHPYFKKDRSLFKSDIREMSNDIEDLININFKHPNDPIELKLRELQTMLQQCYEFSMDQKLKVNDEYDPHNADLGELQTRYGESFLSKIKDFVNSPVNKAFDDMDYVVQFTSSAHNAPELSNIMHKLEKFLEKNPQLMEMSNSNVNKVDFKKYMLSLNEVIDKQNSNPDSSVYKERKKQKLINAKQNNISSKISNVFSSIFRLKK